MSEQSPQGIPQISSKKLGVVGAGAGIVLALVVAIGLVSRASSSTQLKDWTEAQTIPTVSITVPADSQSKATLDLPGQLSAYSQAQIYARASGYLKSWKVDIGDHVKAGQVIAEIETPDLDQQLAQAKADMANTQAALTLAKATASRWKALPADATSPQEVDEKNSALAAQLAQLKSAQANVDRLQTLQKFKYITAPFDGIVTARNTDIGALINANGSSSNGLPLFEISDTRKLRVSVNVPQSDVAGIKVGTEATLTTPTHQGQTFTAKVSAFSQSVNANAGTTLVQFEVNNTDGLLLPGGFVNASIDQHSTPAAARLQVPSSALLFDKNGLRVATVDQNNHVVFKTITIARDAGKFIVVGSGLAATDRVISNPPDGLAAGDSVKIATAPKPDTKA
ncbi:efflux RND transporter periplasmic adaptor subunit [Aquirhabdus parva]|uniref:Efflux RND transporter periplasmic adaptor subunit n=1 Tax=Aquirhabdus parva TaxID=2283318 RepID=A0A345P807_9GAMM|nr:efflux RND transporter periplasmic adaptor subunit [Aquirhabdus parva]AXI03416.1 efflux RND transporter periplasmic adaptor subunit [Aquirhabdus parva]